MKQLLLLFLLIQCNGFSQQWVNNNAKWKYRFQEQGLPGAEGIYETYKTQNLIVGSALCDELVTRRINYFFDGSSWNPIDTVIVDTNYTYKSVTGDTIFWLENGDFQVLYDFSKNTNDTWIISVSNDPNDNNCDDSSSVIVLDKQLINIGLDSYRNLRIYRIDNNQNYHLGGDFNERFGAYGCCSSETLESYIFPSKQYNCWNNTSTSTFFYFLCFEDDQISFDINCDYYTSGLQELTNNITLSPNPFYSKIELGGINFPCEIRLIDNRGILIKAFDSKEKFDDTSFDFLSQGFYSLSIIFEGMPLTNLKLIKD